MPLLLTGRVLGGLSTNLLFSSFESWMVSEHRKRGYPEELLASTFAISSWGNGIMAIIAGLLAQVSADVAGDIGPFQLAILLTIICWVLISFWSENYGHAEGAVLGSISSSIVKSLGVIVSSPSILLLGLGQAFFEGAMYTFVFNWVPSMIAVSPSASLPTGLVFSCFMLAMTIGGLTFGMILPYFPGDAEALCATVYVVAAASLLVPVFYFEFWPVFISFLVFEAMSSIMSVFRLPLNCIVVLGTNLSSAANDKPSLQFVYGVVVGIQILAAIFQIALIIFAPRKKLQPAGKED
eukprot:gene912-1021_t